MSLSVNNLVSGPREKIWYITYGEATTEGTRSPEGTESPRSELATGNVILSPI